MRVKGFEGYTTTRRQCPHVHRGTHASDPLTKTTRPQPNARTYLGDERAGARAGRRQVSGHDAGHGAGHARGGHGGAWGGGGIAMCVVGLVVSGGGWVVCTYWWRFLRRTGHGLVQGVATVRGGVDAVEGVSRVGVVYMDG